MIIPPPGGLSGPIYRDAQRYDAEHWWKTDDIMFWQRMAGRYGPKVLELACGTGRLAPGMLEAGGSYTGVDASQPFLQLAQSKLSPWGNKVRLLHGDMRDLALKETFDLIGIGFNAFLHLLTDEDALRALRTVISHCHPETRLVIDIFIPDPIFLYRPVDQRVDSMTYVDPKNGETVKVTETNDYNPESGQNKITWYYSLPGKPDFLVYDFTMRMLYPDTMDRLLSEAGFRIEAKWGDYEETPMDAESALQIYVATPAQAVGA